MRGERSKCEMSLNLRILLIGTLLLLTLTKINTPTVGLDDEWHRRTDMPTPRANLAAVAVNGKIYAIGGEGGLSAVEEYNPISNSWSARTNMPTPRYSLAAAVVDGMIYVIGGRNAGNVVLTTVEAYDPATNSWSTRTNMPSPRYSLAAAVVDGMIYAVGGRDEKHNAANSVFEFDPDSNSWRTRTSMLTARGFLVAAAVGGKIYAIGGSKYNDETKRWDVLETVEVFDPNTDSWNRVSDMSTPRDKFAATAIGGNIYTIGGDDGFNELSALEVYNTIADLWSRWSDMSTARNGLSVAAVGGKIYAIGGYRRGVLATVEQYDPPHFDTDGDGLSDSDEVGRYRTDPLVPDADADTDGDGLSNVIEADTYGTNPTVADTDGDGLSDGEEVQRGTDPLVEEFPALKNIFLLLPAILGLLFVSRRRKK